MEKIAQLQLGHHPVVFPVEEFLGMVLVGAGGHHGDPVLDFPLVHAGPHQHLGDEVAFVAAKPHHQGAGEHLDLVVGLDPLDEPVQVGLDVQALDGMVDPASDAAQLRFLLQEDGLKSLVPQIEGGVETGDAAADDQGPLVDGQGFFHQGLEQGGPGHRHPHQVLGLVRGLVALLHVHPGVLVADIGHFKEILVQTRVDQGLPEQGLVGDGGASRHHHPVKVVFLDDFGHIDLGVLGAGEQVVFHVRHVGQRPGIFRQLRHADDAADVDAAVADEHPDAGSIFRPDVFRFGGRPGLGLGPADVPQRGAHRPGCGRSLHDRLRDIFGSLHGPADIDARAGSGYGGKGRGGRKIVGVGVHPQGRGQLPARLAHLHAHRQHDHVKGLRSSPRRFHPHTGSANRHPAGDRCCGCGTG